MPLGSSSAAPVIRPGPRCFSSGTCLRSCSSSGAVTAGILRKTPDVSLKAQTSLLVVRPDAHAAAPEGAALGALRKVVREALAARTERVERRLAHRASLLRELCGFSNGERERGPVLRVFAVDEVDGLGEDREEALRARRALQQAHDEVRLVDEDLRALEPLPRIVRGAGRFRPALVAAEALLAAQK